MDKIHAYKLQDEGMDTVEKIHNAPTGAGGPFPTDVPQKQIVIESARVM